MVFKWFLNGPTTIYGFLSCRRQMQSSMLTYNHLSQIYGFLSCRRQMQSSPLMPMLVCPLLLKNIYDSKP